MLERTGIPRKREMERCSHKESIRYSLRLSVITVLPLSVSAYPSVCQAANVSRNCTIRELLDVEGLDFETEAKLENINLLINKTNSVQYMSKMCNFPTLEQLDGLIK